MRLELDSSPAATFVNYNPAIEETEARQLEAQELLRAGIKAAQSGERAESRRLLLKATEIDPQSESSWLWLASLSEYPEELLVFLENVLSINPANRRALDWRSATHKLLASTFIQRGLDAVEANQPDYAAECFNKSLEYDQENAAAWISLASLADSVEGKLVYLEKALSVDPENDDARRSYAEARRGLAATHLSEARAAAVAGKGVEANELLDAVLAEMPDSEDAWMLKAHFADSFEEKIRSFERVLELNPHNAAAEASIFSLRSILDIAAPPAPHEAKSEADVSAAEESAVEQIEDPSRFEEIEPPIAVDEDAITGELANQIETMTVYPLVPNEEAPEWVESVEAIEDVQPSADSSDEAIYEDRFSYDPPEAIEKPETGFETENAAESNAQTSDSIEEPVEFFDTVGEIAIHPANEGFIQRPIWESIAEEVTEEDEIHAAESDSDGDIYGIPMPATELDHASAETFDPFKTVLVREPQPAEIVAETKPCAYCSSENDPQAIVCNSCFAVLTLSDLEMLLSNQSADTAVLSRAVQNLERERRSRELTGEELLTLGIGHLNLRNFRFGYDILHEASQLDPNNVVLASHVNSLLIRLEEIRVQEENRETHAKGKTILVVDDSPTVRKLISGKLEKCGHNVICSEDGVEAMNAIAECVPDLILLDITMPRMDGYQVCKLIRAKEETANVPVIMISGKDGFFDKVRGRMAGTSGYITKPFGPETLMRAVDSYLNSEQPNVE